MLVCENMSTVVCMQVKCAREAGIYFTREQVVDWMAQLIEALRYLHQVILGAFHPRSHRYWVASICYCYSTISPREIPVWLLDECDAQRLLSILVLVAENWRETWH